MYELAAVGTMAPSVKRCPLLNATSAIAVPSQGHVVMGNNAVSPYQQVIEKTKSLSFRSQMLAMNIEKKLNHNNRNEVSDVCPKRARFPPASSPLSNPCL